MGHPIVTTVTLIAGVSNGIAQSQSLPGASNLRLVLNGSLVSGGAVTFDAPRRIVIASAGNDSGLTWTVTGTSRPQQNGGGALVETMTGANVGDAVTTQDFATLTSISASAATAGAVTAGTNGTGSGPWVPWSQFPPDYQVALDGTILTGSPTWQVDYTFDDVYGLWLPSGVPFPRARTLNVLSGQTTSADGQLTNGARASRLTLTVVGGVQLTQTQQGY